MENRLVIVISGTPGTGKTTIANRLKDLLSAECINLTEVAIRNDFILKNDKARQTKVADLEKLIVYLEDLISSHSNNIIIEGHYADIVPDPLISVLIILRTDPHLLERRLIEKQFSSLKIQENLQAEILGSCTSAALENHDWNKIYEVDTSAASIDEILTVLQNIIEKKSSSNVGQINWMQELSGDELIRYFP